MRQPYPLPDTSKIDQTAMTEIDWLQQFIVGVRRIRSEMNIAPGKSLRVLLQGGSKEDRQRLERQRHSIMSLGRLESLAWLDGDEIVPESAIALLGTLKILIPIAGLIDKVAEIGRLNREINKLRRELEKSESKLINADFIGRAPAQVVEKERARVREMQVSMARLSEQLQRLQRL